MPQAVDGHAPADRDRRRVEQLPQSRPGESAPTTTLRSLSITRCLVPRVPLPWVEAPGTAPVGVLTTAMFSPAACAWAAV